jgi:Domain of unknown function (DUF3291)
VTRWQLAQMNVARLVAPVDSPVVAEFMGALDTINALAERSPGFVWRLQSESGNATDILATDDPLFIVNMSVWESIESLRDYVYKTAHVEYLRRRREWFEKALEMHMALWWLPAGELPTVEGGLQRIALVREHGPTAQAFTFARAYAPPQLEEAAG